MIPLSRHFTWREVTRSKTAAERGIDNSLPTEFQGNVHSTASIMEAIRELLGGGPIKVTSWYRCAELNKAIGGSRTSAHMRGLAVDWKPLTVSLHDAFEIVAASPIAFDQLIHEQTRDGARWIHVGLSTSTPRRDIMRASGAVLGGDMQYQRTAAG